MFQSPCLVLLILYFLSLSCAMTMKPRCRNTLIDLSFPSALDWDTFNSSIDGQLVPVVPSALYCRSRNCTEEEWQSTVFRATIPGAMDEYNWEQDYVSEPPSMCLQNGTTCGQGRVPMYAINATEARHIQAGVNFASQHNLRISIKASGHDYLGRSTAKGSLLLWTHNFQNISFLDSYIVNGTDMGSAVTVGSGVPLNTLYNVTKEAGKYYVGGNTASVVAAGGYVQGGGHSIFSPIFGLAADNALEFSVVIANGSIVTANAVENPNLFWALRGGGAGSWGVILSATFRTYPIFNATIHGVLIIAPSNASTASLMSMHARHIFDWDDVRAGQYFYLFKGPTQGYEGNVLALGTYFANMSANDAKNAMQPLLNEARNMGFAIEKEQTIEGLANDLLSVEDAPSGSNGAGGSRLIPVTAYQNNTDTIGKTIATLLEQGVQEINGFLVAGGKVAENANISSAVTPKWRTAKTHIIVTQGWPDSLSPNEVEAVRQNVTNKWVPILASMTGETDSGAYSNEADVREPNFQQTFFGTNYAKLKSIKQTYDPEGLFIVGAGVGSEDWDEDGLCRV